MTTPHPTPPPPAPTAPTHPGQATTPLHARVVSTNPASTRQADAGPVSTNPANTCSADTGSVTTDRGRVPRRVWVGSGCRWRIEVGA